MPVGRGCILASCGLCGCEGVAKTEGTDIDGYGAKFCVAEAKEGNCAGGSIVGAAAKRFEGCWRRSAMDLRFRSGILMGPWSICPVTAKHCSMVRPDPPVLVY
ncbi:uncharacterized protein LY79DRAFT_575855 [Colletotrichum navitas]|uniref:Uncharacterized protein n=1 Tax=Colletotrichum navitas TaxID=681940 RepID=A0AAD8VB22_9PEZI|nr:uncharacterized protein LY79DRAFT_575855 [Colletotrichum navitas]KAK1598698.1 hypothetical protein LY79DRAFT_575855 [Colletotrichum navitas]